jgi:hypothetical protein
VSRLLIHGPQYYDELLAHLACGLFSHETNPCVAISVYSRLYWGWTSSTELKERRFPKLYHTSEDICSESVYARWCMV